MHILCASSSANACHFCPLMLTVNPPDFKHSKIELGNPSISPRWLGMVLLYVIRSSTAKRVAICFKLDTCKLQLLPRTARYRIM